jgi:excisionase family DNA binding protein
MKQNGKPYVTAADAKEFGIGEATWYRLLREGEIKSIKAGKKYIVPRAAFLAWYNSAGGQIGDAA